MARVTGAAAPSGRVWRLPWKVKVPERDELIAYALATLAMGLVLGLAIGPGLGGADRLLPILSPPVAAVPALPEEDSGADLPTTLPPLGAPAGSEAKVLPQASPVPAPPPAPVTVATATAPAPAAPVPLPDEPPEPPPAPAPAPDPVPVPPPGPGDEEALTLKGTVLAQAATGRSYSIADSFGNLATVYSAEPADPGLVVSVPVEPLSNGTFGEDGLRQAVNLRSRASVKGMVSWVDPVAGILVLSNRGASLPLDASQVLLPETELPVPGAWVEAGVAIESVPIGQASTETDPPPTDEQPRFGLTLEKLTPLDEQAISIELSGRVEEVDPDLGLIRISADSLGLLPDLLELSVPPRFGLERVRTGRFYSATVRVLEDGTLRLSGFSPAFNRKAADDPSEAFGEQR
jgi:hypothetical protein